MSMRLSTRSRHSTAQKPQSVAQQIFEDAKKQTKGRLVVDPRSAKWLSAWDCSTALALVYTALITPFEVSFLSTPGWTLWLVNRGIDLLFAADIALQFCLAYPQNVSQSGDGGIWILNHQMIVKQYLSSWFAIDFLSTLVSIFDIVTFTSEASFSKLKILRVLRVLRLAKMLRLLRGMRLFRRWESQMSIDYGALSLLQSMVVVCLCAHWSACTWTLQVQVKHVMHGMHVTHCMHGMHGMPLRPLERLHLDAADFVHRLARGDLGRRRWLLRVARRC